MFSRKRLIRFSKLFAVLLAAVLLLCACSANAVETAKRKKNTAAPAVTETPAVAEPTAEPGPLDEAQRIADYIFEHGKLPDNFITKKEAQALGWDKYVNKVSDVAPGKSIGGDYFGNYEKQLPVVQGRKYYEADCFYFGGDRNEYRIIYSNDGHVWFTGDHYQTFTELFPSKTE